MWNSSPTCLKITDTNRCPWRTGVDDLIHILQNYPTLVPKRIRLRPSGDDLRNKLRGSAEELRPTAQFLKKIDMLIWVVTKGYLNAAEKEELKETINDKEVQLSVSPSPLCCGLQIRWKSPHFPPYESFKALVVVTIREHTERQTDRHTHTHTHTHTHRERDTHTHTLRQPPAHTTVCRRRLQWCWLDGDDDV